MKLHKLAALAAVASCSAWSVGAQANVTVYTDLSSFLAAAPGATNLPIPAPAGGDTFEDVGSPYTLGPVTFSVEGIGSGGIIPLDDLSSGISIYQDYGYSDDLGNSIPYIGSFGTSQTMSSTGSQLGLQLGLYRSESDIPAFASAKSLIEPFYNISYVANGEYGSVYLPYSPDTAFLGFISDGGPVSVTFTQFSFVPEFDLEAEDMPEALPYELDTTAIYVNGSAVPEPATWAMMIGGLGLAGGVMRRRYRKSEDAFTAKVRSIAFDA